jgi:predicted DNA-binding protein
MSTLAASTTTIRIDRDVHQRFVALSKESGQQLIDTMREAVETLERARFIANVTREIDALRQDPTAWTAYLEDGEIAIDDGIS